MHQCNIVEVTDAQVNRVTKKIRFTNENILALRW